MQHYLPGLLTGNFEPVTVRQPLNHTSGIQPGAGLGTTFEELYAHRFDTLVTGHSYASEATRRILLPAGMGDTYFPGTDPSIRGPHNLGYQAVRQPDGTTAFVDVTEWNHADRWAAGDMISTTVDLERLLTRLFRGDLVPRPQLKEMFTVPRHIKDATMSAGLQRFEFEGQLYWLKSGARYGYGTLIAATRDLSRTLVVSVGATDAKSEDMNPVTERIARAALK